MIDVPNTTLLEKMEALSYMIDKDFSIKITTKDELHAVDLKVGSNKRFFIEPVITFKHLIIA